ncbi:hypothetical protein IL306_008379 [Fusarium sp. DS 682]|nr:hypothetical protein IL306_008379 [Fusarium sp. DS 682]
MSTADTVIVAADQIPPPNSEFEWPNRIAEEEVAGEEGQRADEEEHEETWEGFSDEEAYDLKDQENGDDEVYDPNREESDRDEEIGDSSVLTKKRIEKKRYSWWRCFRTSTRKHEKGPWVKVDKDVRSAAWEALVIGEGSPETLHQLARANAWDMRRWAMQSRVAFHEFCLTVTNTRPENIRCQEDETRLAARVRRWARWKLKRARIPIHNKHGLTLRYRAIRTTNVGLRWSRVWSYETEKLIIDDDLENGKIEEDISSIPQKRNAANILSTATDKGKKWMPAFPK